MNEDDEGGSTSMVSSSKEGRKSGAARVRHRGRVAYLILAGSYSSQYEMGRWVGTKRHAAEGADAESKVAKWWIPKAATC